MKSQIYELLYREEGLSPQEVAAHILMAAVIGVVIYVSYGISHKGTIYSKKFNVSLLVLTVLTGTVMTVIGNNVALSLGMVGALSIVRFRTALKDSRDTVYVFWTIIVGICCGVGDYLVAAIGSSVTFFVLLLFGAVKNDNRMLLIIRAGRNAGGDIKALVYQLFDGGVLLRVENTTAETVELIYEFSNKTLAKAQKKNGSVCDAIYAVGQVEYANLVLQNDEVSS
ncbi:hypothetical protein C806_00586 [Lachnospiraceae bacterium 3-1]|nr:hypothetical protein C806_00586 [Lachnospiraceae bacterium 3-1]